MAVQTSRTRSAADPPRTRARSAIADDHHVAYIYFPDGHWDTVVP